jgi:hypothetical protein
VSASTGTVIANLEGINGEPLVGLMAYLVTYIPSGDNYADHWGAIAYETWEVDDGAEDGVFRFTDVTPGTYLLWVSEPKPDVSLPNELWPNLVFTETPVITVEAGQVVTHTFRAAIGGSIRITVVDEHGTVLPRVPAGIDTQIQPLVVNWAPSGLGSSSGAAVPFTYRWLDTGTYLLQVHESGEFIDQPDQNVSVTRGETTDVVVLVKCREGYVLQDLICLAAPNQVLGASVASADCPNGQIACEDQCVDVTTDISHCGACGHQCTDVQTCVGGQCQAFCTDGFIWCDGQCLDSASDPNNCGGCGTTCGVGLVCTLGECLCAEGMTNCVGACVDTLLDPWHCGGCGIGCQVEENCTDGRCVPEPGRGTPTG